MAVIGHHKQGKVRVEAVDQELKILGVAALHLQDIAEVQIGFLEIESPISDLCRLVAVEFHLIVGQNSDQRVRWQGPLHPLYIPHQT